MYNNTVCLPRHLNENVKWSAKPHELLDKIVGKRGRMNTKNLWKMTLKKLQLEMLTLPLILLKNCTSAVKFEGFLNVCEF